MNIEALRTAALVARLGSFAAAARAMDVDPSAISRAIARVEDSLNVRLFQRTTRTLSLTEEGEIYLSRVEPLIEELDLARAAAVGNREIPAGTLRLTASVAFAHECILPLLPEFHERYPEVTLELLPTDANLDLFAGGIDLAIRLAAAPEGELISTRLLHTRYRVCASPGFVGRHGALAHPRELESVDCLRFALPEFRDRWIFVMGEDEPFSVPVSGSLLISSALLLRQAARDGMGPALLADWLIDRDLSDGRLVDLFPEHECTATQFDTGAWALYPSRAYLPGKVRVMIDFLRERIGKSAQLARDS